MTTIKQVAEAFINGESATCYNALTNGTEYQLHRTIIANKLPDGGIQFSWGGWYTATTANHMNKILETLGEQQGNKYLYDRVSYARSRDNNETAFIIDPR